MKRKHVVPVLIGTGVALGGLAFLMSSKAPAGGTDPVIEPGGGGTPPKPPKDPGGGTPPTLPPRSNLRQIAKSNIPKPIVDATALPFGWSTFGWYSYTGNSGMKRWIRVDKGPWTSGMATSEQPWRWTIIQDTTPIATEVQTFSQVDGIEDVLDLIGLGWEGRNDDIMGMVMPRLAAEWIDEAFP